MNEIPCKKEQKEWKKERKKKKCYKRQYWGPKLKHQTHCAVLCERTHDIAQQKANIDGISKGMYPKC